MKDFFKFMMACLCAMVLVFMLVIAVFVSAIIGISATSSTSTVVKPNSVYQIDLSGVLEERTDDDPAGLLRSTLMGQEPETTIGLDDLLLNIKKAKENSNIKGIYLHGGHLASGMASMREVRRALMDFSQSGKFILAYADTYGQGNYYLASCADSLFVNPYGSIDWHGLSMTLNFYKKLADNLGVDVQIFRVGSFKSAVEPYMLDKMSDANRLQSTTMLSNLWAVLCEETGDALGMSADSLRALADQGVAFHDAQQYVQAGMAHRLVYEADMDSIIGRAVGDKDYHILKHSDMLGVSLAKANKAEDKIAVVYACGNIVDSGSDGIVGKKMVKTLSDVADDEDVKAVVLRVNSPGGSAYASEQIWYAVQQLKHKKPVVVSMGDYAASGGYYISCAADSIFAQPTTITGSIGIFGIVPNVSRLANRVGVTSDNVKTSRYADIEEKLVFGTPTDEEKDLVQQSVNRGYDQFTRRCADGRHTTQQAIFEVASGRVWTGTDALTINLVDRLGYLDDAIASAALLAGVEKYKVCAYPEPETWQQKMMEALDIEATAQKYVSRAVPEQYKTLIDMLAAKDNTARIQARMDIAIETR